MDFKTSRVPNEVWTEIFSYFQGSLPTPKWQFFGSPNQPHLRCTTLPTLASLCLVCKHFNRMAQPILYDTPLLFEQDPTPRTFEHQDTLFNFVQRHHALRNYAFVHTLLKNPSLGNMVRNLFIYHDEQHDASTLKSVFDDVKFREDAKDAFQLPPRLRSYLETVSLERRQFCFASYALALTPNVRIVHIDGCSVLPLVSWMLSGSLDLERGSFLATPAAEAHRNGYGPGLSDQEVETITAKIHKNFGLPSLEEICIRCADKVDGSTSVEAIETIFLHPKLRTLRLLGIDWRGTHVQSLKWTSYPSNLKTLELNDSFIDAAGLENILKRFPMLETLIIELGGRYRTRPSDWHVDLHQFGQVLRKYGQGLSTLSLHCEGYESELMDLHSSTGSLQSLKALRHLAITKQRLLSGGGGDGTSKTLTLEEALPLSLETLSFLDRPGWRGEQRNESIRKFRNKQIYQLITSGLFHNLRQIKDERPIQDLMPFDIEIPGWYSSLTEERRRESLSHEYNLSYGHVFDYGVETGDECNIITLSRKEL